MSEFKPTPIEGAVPCEECDGTGTVDEGKPTERECPVCDGLGEWFE